MYVVSAFLLYVQVHTELTANMMNEYMHISLNHRHQCWFHSYSNLCHKLKWISLHDRHHYYTIIRLSALFMDCIKFDNYFAFKG